MPAVEPLLMLLHKLCQLRVPDDSIFQELVLFQLCEIAELKPYCLNHNLIVPENLRASICFVDII